MHATAYSALLLAVLSGTAAANSDPIQLDPTAANIRHAGHIYYNIATGEKITILIESGDVQEAVDGIEGSEIWIACTSAQCADQGFSTSYFFPLSDPNGSTNTLSDICFDWGDIAIDTVVDCVTINWVTDHADADQNSDGLPDGVEGFAATWAFWDGMNGRSPQLESIAMPLIQFSLYNLPGEFPIDTSAVSYYTADIDLGDSLSSSMTFEIGDTDSDLQGTAIHNPRMDLRDHDADGIPDLDPDQDSLADWGWSIQFIQPGTVDVDNADADSDWQTGIDGDPNAIAVAGITIGSPSPGHAELNSEGEWVWISDGPTAGATEDLLSIGESEYPDGSGEITIRITSNFGGLNCEPDPTFGQYMPAAHFSIVLYGDSLCAPCTVDLAGSPDGSPDGTLNFQDIARYLSLYTAEDPRADFAGNPNGAPDGLFNFLDVAAYLSLYAQGCGPC